MNRLIERFAFLTQGADEGDHHQAIEHGYARQRDETNPRRNGKRNIPQPQRQDAAGQGKGHAGEHQQSVLDVVEHREQQHEHQQQRHWNHDLQTLSR